MSGLPREVIKWLQSLNLPYSVKTPHWDITNGFLIAEILRIYFPKKLQCYQFHNASSLELKLCNWTNLKKLLKKLDLVVPEKLLNAAMHCKDGAGRAILVTLYELLTKNSACLNPINAVNKDFTDHGYQDQLPLYARATALSSLRSNFKSSERELCKDIMSQRMKSYGVVEQHSQRINNLKNEHPHRFDHQENVQELALRKTPPPSFAIHLDPGCVVNED